MSLLSVMRCDYNENSSPQSQALQIFKPFLNSAIAALSPDLPSCDAPFVIADFGCSTGLNSSDAISHVIREVRCKYNERCISSMLVVLNDLPRNHWNELFSFLYEDERSFVAEHSGVFPTAVGKSFYAQVLPNNSLHFGISTFSLHWCSQVPVEISDYSKQADRDDKRQMFAEQAARDWYNFLTARSKELVSGGVLALSFLGASEQINLTHDEYYQAVRTLCTRGVIDSSELLDFNFRMHYRTLEEVTDKSQYESLGLELLRAEDVEQPPAAHYVEFLKHGDVHLFAQQFSGFLSAPLEPSFLEALSPARSEEEKLKVCEELRVEFKRRIADHPEKFDFTVGLIFLVIRRK